MTSSGQEIIDPIITGTTSDGSTMNNNERPHDSMGNLMLVDDDDDSVSRISPMNVVSGKVRERGTHADLDLELGRRIRIRRLED